MWRIRPLVTAAMAVIIAGCSQSDLPPGVLEMELPVGKFQVTTPDEWVETPELGGFNAVESPDLDLVFSVLSIDPTSEQMSIYRDPRTYNLNGRSITVYDGPFGGHPDQYFGIEYYPEEAFHALVDAGEHRYHVVLIRSSTAAPRDDLAQILVELAASLEAVP